MAMDMVCPNKCGPVIKGEDGEPLCNCGHFGGSGETLTKGPWPLSKSEERILRGVAAMLVAIQCSREFPAISDEDVGRLCEALAEVGRKAIEGA